MRRILVDLRVFLATVIVLGAALGWVSFSFWEVHSAPVQHVVEFHGVASAKVVNYTTVVAQQNLTESGVPVGALLGFNWTSIGPYGVDGVLAYSGTSPTGNYAVVCASGITMLGSCAWTANGQSFTISILQSSSGPGASPANYTTEVNVLGWYEYSTPAH